MSINWQPPSTAPRDTSYLAILTINGDIECWQFDRNNHEWRAWAIPGMGERRVRTNGTIKAWARWSEVFDLVRKSYQSFQSL